MHHPLTGLYANLLFVQLRALKSWPVRRVRLEVTLTEVVCCLYIARSAWLLLGVAHLVTRVRATRSAVNLARALRLPVRARVELR